MISFNRKCLAVFGVLAIGLAYLMYEPIPDGFSDPTKVRTIFAVLKLNKFLGNIYCTLTGNPQWVWVRKITSLITPAPSYHPDVVTTETTFDGIKVRIYSHKSKQANSPAVIYIHGGGFVVWNIDMYDKKTMHLAANLKMVVISIDYRLAPEHPYPAAVEDGYAAITYFITNAPKYGVNPKRIVVMGDSAGANLAAAMTLKLRDEAPELLPLKLQVLIYPSLQKVDLTTPSHQHNTRDPLLNRDLSVQFTLLTAQGSLRSTKYQLEGKVVDSATQKKYASTYLNHNRIPALYKLPMTSYKKKPIKDNIPGIPKLQAVLTDPYYAPLLADSVRNLPTAYIFACGLDPLRDDAIFYAHRLRDAGVKVEFRFMENGWHGIMQVPGLLQETLEEEDRVMEFIRNNV